MDAKPGMKVYLLQKNVDSHCTWGWSFRIDGIYARKEDAERQQKMYIEKQDRRGSYCGIYGVPISEIILE